jgi:aconitate hydratase
VLPLQFKNGVDWQWLGLSGDEMFDILGINAQIKPQQDLQLSITYADGTRKHIDLLVRIDTPIEVEYYLHGGILPYVLREILAL